MCALVSEGGENLLSAGKAADEEHSVKVSVYHWKTCLGVRVSHCRVFGEAHRQESVALSGQEKQEENCGAHYSTMIIIIIVFTAQRK